MELLVNMVAKLYFENVLKNIFHNKKYHFMVNLRIKTMQICVCLFVYEGHVGKQNIPVVCVIVEGGTNTIRTVVEYVTEEPPVEIN